MGLKTPTKTGGSAGLKSTVAARPGEVEGVDLVGEDIIIDFLFIPADLLDRISDSG